MSKLSNWDLMQDLYGVQGGSKMKAGNYKFLRRPNRELAHRLYDDLIELQFGNNGFEDMNWGTKKITSCSKNDHQHNYSFTLHG